MKLFHVISTSILGAAMAIGVGLAVANARQGFKEARAAGTITLPTNSTYFSAADSTYTNSTTGHDANNKITVTVSKAYVTGAQVRVDKGATITVISDTTDNLDSIAFTFSGTYTGGLNSSYTGLTGKTWSVETSTSGSNARITQIDVTTVAGGQTYSITYTAGTNGTGSYTHSNQPEGNYKLLSFGSLTGVSPSTGYSFLNYTVGGVSKNPGDTITLSASTTITVNFQEKPLSATYDFTNNWDTYAKDWGGYAPHTVLGTDVGADYNATITFTNVSKQGGTITDRPVIAAKDGVASTMAFSLDATVSASYNITSVTVSFQRWSNSKQVGAALYKGSSVAGDALDSFAETAAPSDLTTANLNGDAFIVDFTTSQSSNQQLGITSIEIGLVPKAVFGTLDHIKVTSLPNTIYHVDEYFDHTGLQVTAYDDADESTAAYKDVTDDIDTLIDDSYQFEESDVPGFDVDIEYTESAITKATSYHLVVYAKAEYELVTSEPTDWSGSYLLVATYVGSDSASHTVALNSALVNFDQPLNFKEVTVSGNEIITGQECEFLFAKYNTGYSMQGKNGKYAYGNGSNRFITSDTPHELSLSFDTNIVTVTGGGGFFLRMNTSTAGAERFGFYDKGASDISFYKLKASDDADIYAQLFLETLSTGASAVCHYDPSTHIVSTDLDELRIAWELLAEEYDTSLSASDKEQFRLGVASEDPGASNIAKALALYDHIVNAYGEQLKSGEFTNYNFMNRSYGLQPGQVSVTSHLSNNTVITIVIITSVIALTSVGCFFIIRRKKHN